jgi:carbon-monoxide dehydrogenase medium subunit
MIVCQGSDGRKRRIPADVFLEGAFQTMLRADEILVAIEVPRLSAEARWGYYKVCRKSREFAHAIGAVVVDPKRGICRIVAGATDGPPKLLPETAAALAGENASIARDRLEDELAFLLPERDIAGRRLHATAVRRALEAMSVRSDQ